MTTYRTALQKATKTLQNQRIDNAAQDARWLLIWAAGLSRQQFLISIDEPIPPETEIAYQAVIDQRARFCPVSKITGQKAFWGHMFKVTPDVLDPRPETETLIQAALDYGQAAGWKNGMTEHGPVRILDLGAGSGCLLLTMLDLWPAASGCGIDISPNALKVAQHNANVLKIRDRVHFSTGNWLEGIDEAYDIVLSNPPYISQEDAGNLQYEVVQWDPPEALFAGHDGLEAYRVIAMQLGLSLKPGGAAFFEIGSGQAHNVKRIMVSQGLEVFNTHEDMNGHIRCLSIRRCV